MSRRYAVDKIMQFCYKILIMNPTKCNAFINFLTVTSKAFSCTRARKMLRLTKHLHRFPANAYSVKEKSSRFISHINGVLIPDEPVLDKPYAQENRADYTKLPLFTEIVKS